MDEARVAFVTGGARGIGAAIAERLAEQGHLVAVADLRVDDAEKTAARLVERGGRAEAVTIDVTSTDSVTAGVAHAEELGPIGVLVNCAGWDELARFVDTSEPFWQRVVDINYLGVLRTTKALLPGMSERGWGRVVNIGSDAARVGSSLEAVYAGAKAAVIGFTKTIAREVAGSGVTANVVCPGPCDTPLLSESVEKFGGGERLLEAVRRSIPLGRLATADDVAGAVAFFASEQAGYVTGQTLSVSGGLTMA